PSALKGFANSIQATLDYLSIPAKDLLIQIKSSIPPGKGLGSSASVAIALVKSIFSYAGRAYSDTELLDLANIAETYNHGSPSGIDTLTITSGSPVWFEKEHSSSYLIKPKGEFRSEERRVGKDSRVQCEQC